MTEPGEMRTSLRQVFTFAAECTTCALRQVTEHHSGCLRLLLRAGLARR